MRERTEQGTVHRIESALHPLAAVARGVVTRKRLALWLGQTAHALDRILARGGRLWDPRALGRVRRARTDLAAAARILVGRDR